MAGMLFLSATVYQKTLRTQTLLAFSNVNMLLFKLTFQHNSTIIFINVLFHFTNCKSLTNNFNKGILFSFQSSIFHPYLSLQQMELLKSPRVRSFVIGASNYLYKRQKGLSEVLVDVSKFKTIEVMIWKLSCL